MKKMTYAEAMNRLEEIVGKVQDGRIDIDELAGLLKEAQELVNFCREKLYKVDEEIKALTGRSFSEKLKALPSWRVSSLPLKTRLLRLPPRVSKTALIFPEETVNSAALRKETPKLSTNKICLIFIFISSVIIDLFFFRKHCKQGFKKELTALSGKDSDTPQLFDIT